MFSQASPPTSARIEREAAVSRVRGARVVRRRARPERRRTARSIQRLRRSARRPGAAVTGSAAPTGLWASSGWDRERARGDPRSGLTVGSWLLRICCGLDLHLGRGLDAAVPFAEERGVALERLDDLGTLGAQRLLADRHATDGAEPRRRHRRCHERRRAASRCPAPDRGGPDRRGAPPVGPAPGAPRPVFRQAGRPAAARALARRQQAPDPPTVPPGGGRAAAQHAAVTPGATGPRKRPVVTPTRQRPLEQAPRRAGRQRASEESARDGRGLRLSQGRGSQQHDTGQDDDRPRSGSHGRSSSCRRRP